MHKSLVLALSLLLVASCKQEPNSTIPRDTSVPTLSFELVSYASAFKFIPFGGILPGGSVNKGYEFQLNDTNQAFYTTCSGIVTAVGPAGGGSSAVTVIYKRNSIYTFVYSGVRNVLVQVNDSVVGSTIIGMVGNSGIIDFKIVKNGNEALCPLQFAGSGFNQSVTTAIEQSNASDPEDTIASPCLVQSLPN